MDFNVHRGDYNRWILTDLLGRTAGRIEQQRTGMFRIVPADRFVEVLRDLTPHTLESLDHALRAIEIAARGSCRLKADGADPEGPPLSLATQSDENGAILDR